jgi:hypothetical protein
VARKFLTPVDFGGNKGTNAANGTAATDLATVGQTVPRMAVIWADSLGIDNTGATSVSSAVQSAINAASGPCVVVFGAGTYKFSTGITLGKEQSVRGQGSTATNFTWSGSGPLFTVSEPAVSGTWDGSDDAGMLAGFTISGPGGSTNSAGIKYGALQGLHVDDVSMFGLDGGAVIGFEVTSGVDWAEESVFTRLNISGCGATSGFVFSFDGTSFDYTLIDAIVVVQADIDVIALSGGALMQGLDLGLRGNLHGGTSNTGAVISIDKGNPSGTSLIGGAIFRVSLEADDASAGGSGTVGPFLLVMGSTNAASQFSAQGTFFVYNAGAACQGIQNDNSLPLSFTGIMNDGVNDMLQGEAGVVYGGQALTKTAMGFGSLFENTIFPEFADVFAFQLASGANAITFDATSKYVRRFNFLIKQPSSGAAGTVTWPASFHWLTGSAPALSTASNAIDQIDAIWDPVTSTYYARPGNGSIGGGTLAGYLAPAVVSLTFGATIAVNAALGNTFAVTLTASTGTIANPTNPVDGQAIKIRVRQDGTGGRTVSWGTAYDFGTAGAPTLSTGANKVDILGFEYVGALSKWCYLGAGLGF